MQKQFYLVVLAFLSLITPSFAQFNDTGNVEVDNDDITLVPRPANTLLIDQVIILAPKKSCAVQRYTPARSKSGYC